MVLITYFWEGWPYQKWCLPIYVIKHLTFLAACEIRRSARSAIVNKEKNEDETSKHKRNTSWIAIKRVKSNKGTI